MAQSIPVFSCVSAFVGLVDEAQAHSMLEARTHRLVRDRLGQVRRLYERPEEAARPVGTAASSCGAGGLYASFRFTYRERVCPPCRRPTRIHMLKRFLPRTGEFVPW